MIIQNFKFLSLSTLLMCSASCAPIVSSKEVGSGPGVIYALPTSIVSVKVTLGSVPVFDAAGKKRKQELESVIKSLKSEIANADDSKKPALKTKLTKLENELKQLVSSAPKVRALQLIPGAETVLADSKAQFLLSYNPSYNSHDTVEVKTTENGLLKSISSTASDKTGEALSLVVKAGADAAVFFASGGFSDLALDSVGQVSGQKRDPNVGDCNNESDYEVEVPIDPSDQEAAFQSMELAIKSKTGRECVFFDAYDSRARLIYTTDPQKFSLRDTEAITELKSISEVDRGKCSKGACYRRKGGVIFHLRHKDQRVASFPTILSAPQLGAIGWIDFERREFIESKSEAEFNNGSLVRVKYSKPSELLAFVNIPVDVLESIFGIPAKLFETEAGRLEGEAKVIEAETGLIESRIKLLEQQKKERESLEIE